MVTTRNALSTAALFAVLAFVGAIDSRCAYAANDYLKAIEAEGNQLEPLGIARKEEEALRRQQDAAAKLATPKPAASAPRAGADEQRAFEDELRRAYPGSFALYVSMTPKDKQAVYAEYRNSRYQGVTRFLPVITKIISISAQSRTQNR